MKRIFYALIALLLPLLLFSSCRNGRLNFFSWEDELALKDEVHEQIVADSLTHTFLPEEKYAGVYTHLRAICNKLSYSAKTKKNNMPIQWSIYVLQDDNTVNAFSIPGGGIYIYTGLLRFVKNEAELAGIMAHEMAHVYCRHATSALSKQLGVSLFFSLLEGITDTDINVFGDVAANTLLLKFSRDDEREADKYAVDYLAGTDYDIGEFITFFRDLEQLEREEQAIESESLQNVLEFYSTHPNPQHRIENIKKEWSRRGNPHGKTFANEYKEWLKKLPKPQTEIATSR